MFPVDQGTLLYVAENRDMLFCYFSLGLLLQLPVTVMRFFLVDTIGLGPGELAEFAALVAFPWAVKPVTAFFSENVVSRCVQRRVQVAVAYGLSGLCWSAFLFFSGDRGTTYLVGFYALLSSFFSSYADVCLDACMVRRIHRNSAIHGEGRLQSFTLSSRAFGGLVGSFLSGALALLLRPFLFISLLHLVGVFCGLKLKSLPVHRDREGRSVHKSTWSTCSEMVKALAWSERLVFVGVLFVLATPVSDFAIMQFFFQKKKNVSPMIFSVSDATASVMIIAGSLFFNAFLKQKPWQSIVMLTQCVLFILLTTNMLMITGVIEVNASFYLIVRSLVGSFFGQIGFMPLAVKAADLVPEGFEGTFYSLYMSTVNLGSVVGEEMSGLLTRALGKTLNATAVFYVFVVVHNIASLLCFHVAYG